ncbi:MAG: hypothetical protein CYG60_02405 [Actinobacteria bacterium]|nr:hypothetical protein [Actinomycetota bacterium]PLS87342.1 MAG: hypothetical protein CYG60_02405 [Actinomycetota bacterium]
MDDYRELIALPNLRHLLFGAPDRYRTVRATVRVATNGTLASQTAKRFHDHASERGMIYHLYSRERVSSKEDEPVGIPPDHFSWIWDIGDSENTVRIWYEKPDRWREEVERQGDPQTFYSVADGGLRWVYDPPERVFHTSDNYAVNRNWPPIFGLLNPSLLGERLNPVLMRIVDQGAHAGRETLEVEARTISLDYPPCGLSGLEGADDYVLSVDAEIGVILRYAERLRGEEFYVAQVTELALDEQFPEGTFRFVLPEG